jgi:hypothetical protein
MKKFKDLPIEIQNKMLDRQEEQGNKRDESVFIECIDSVSYIGGFDWHKTIEGSDFWGEVIMKGNHELFFEKYARQNIPELKGILMEVSDFKDFSDSQKREVIGAFNGKYVCMASDRSYIVEYNYARPIMEPKEITIEEAQEMIGDEFKIIK